MNELNPELESQIKSLGRLCCRQLNREEFEVEPEANAIIQALVRGGYERISNINLQARVEACAFEECKDLTMHRREELAAIASRFQRKFRRQIEPAALIMFFPVAMCSLKRLSVVSILTIGQMIPAPVVLTSSGAAYQGSASSTPPLTLATLASGNPVKLLDGIIKEMDENSISVIDPSDLEHTLQLNAHTRCILDGKEAFMSMQIPTIYLTNLWSSISNSAEHRKVLGENIRNRNAVCNDYSAATYMRRLFHYISSTATLYALPRSRYRL